MCTGWLIVGTVYGHDQAKNFEPVRAQLVVCRFKVPASESQTLISFLPMSFKDYLQQDKKECAYVMIKNMPSAWSLLDSLEDPDWLLPVIVDEDPSSEIWRARRAGRFPRKIPLDSLAQHRKILMLAYVLWGKTGQTDLNEAMVSATKHRAELLLVHVEAKPGFQKKIALFDWTASGCENWRCLQAEQHQPSHLAGGKDLWVAVSSDWNLLF